jgi:SAM-dependent methyltransferase
VSPAWVGSLDVHERDGNDLLLVVDVASEDRTAPADAEALVGVPRADEIVIVLAGLQTPDEHAHVHIDLPFECGHRRAACQDDTVADPLLWEQHAGWWQREFTDGADPEYEDQILPLVDEHLAGARRVLDVGCGEGQVSRRVAALGADVIGVDPTRAQLDVAAQRGGAPRYVRGVAERLPCRSGAFDGVVMCLVIEHIDPFEPAIEEIARALAPGGRFLLLLNHPLLQTTGSGWVDDHILDEQYWRVGPYLTDDPGSEEVAPGVVLPFVHRPLSRYVHKMGEVGLLIDDMAEPAPPAGFLAKATEYRDAASIPRLMVIRSRRLE